MTEGGALSHNVGALLGSGPGRGMGLMYEVIGVTVLLLTLIALSLPSMRRLEQLLPDQVDSTTAQATS